MGRFDASFAVADDPRLARRTPMSQLRHLVLVRHGETDGESSIRFHGSTDVPLSAEGRAQMRRVSGHLGGEEPDLVIASPLRRSWHGAWIVGRGAPVRLEHDFREVHFGRWEGLTKEEIEARDPSLYQEWQSGAEGFGYPGGESRAAFRERVQNGLDRVLAVSARSAVCVLHKGVIRVIAETLSGEVPSDAQLELGGQVEVSRRPDGTWVLGRRGSNPAGLDEAAA